MRKTVTLVEVIAGAIILALTFIGLLSIFINVRRYVTRANKRIIATNLVVCQLNSLYPAVREDTWDDIDGVLKGATRPMPAYTIDNHVYRDNEYTVVELTPTYDYRRVSVSVNYP